MSRTAVTSIANEIADNLYGTLARYEAARLDHDIFVELKRRLQDDTGLLDDVIAGCARDARISIERAHAPRRHPGQTSLFSGEALIILGDGERVKMAAVRRDDSLRRQRVLVENKKAQDDAFYDEMDYWQARDAIWLERPELSLGEIEDIYFRLQADD